MSSFRMFHCLDAPRKYAGATFTEIVLVGSIVLTGLILDKIAISLCLGAFSFKLLRTVSGSNKIKVWKRWCYFNYKDLRSGSKSSNRFFL